MTHIYGHRFTATFGETAVDTQGELTDTAKTWATGLSGLTGEQIADGLMLCCDSPPEEWPDLPMFRNKCKGKRLNGFDIDYIPECYRAAPRILDKSKLLSSEDREMRRNAVKESIVALRNSLNEKPTVNYHNLKKGV